jgi:hypothetical protein
MSKVGRIFRYPNETSLIDLVSQTIPRDQIRGALRGLADWIASAHEQRKTKEESRGYAHPSDLVECEFKSLKSFRRRLPL